MSTNPPPNLSSGRDGIVVSISGISGIIIITNHRYIFIPLGGSKHYIPNLFIIFTYTSLWHEFNLSLLGWGYVLIIGMIIEHTFILYIPTTKLYHTIRPLPTYKYYLSLATIFPGTFLYIANNFGFGVGFKLFSLMIF